MSGYLPIAVLPGRQYRVRMTTLRPGALASALLALILLTGCVATPAPADNTTDDTVVEEAQTADEPPVDAEPSQEAAAPADPSPAPVASTYAAGDFFDESCSVAWPSAPQVTATDIQITSYCPNVPNSYAVVLVVYGDPTLPITTSTGSFRVIGEVYGSATSQAGMPYLIVLADEVRL